MSEEDTARQVEMTPERWRTLKAAVQAALETPVPERAAVLDRACGPDVALRREAESLLAAGDVADSFLNPPALADRDLETGSGTDGPALLTRLTKALAGRYVIERELGHGGTARVYLARDVKHRRPVALKVLRPHLSEILGPGRFRREIETAANLSHPHILALHDSGEADGLLYYVMPYVAGESLRERLKRDGSLPVNAALKVIREVADALDHAHRLGVIHRDIKPENVLLDEAGHTMIADFGIARAVRDAAAGGEPESDACLATGDTLTQTGAVIGTPAYMSPEQALGDPTLDGRSDVYSLGCVAYELLAGAPPFAGSTAEQFAQRLRAPPPPLTARRPDLPAHVDAVLARGLAVAPAARFPTATAFAHALAAALSAEPVPLAARARPSRWLLALGAAGLVVLAVLGALAARVGRRPLTSAPAGAPVLAVLPFENLGPPADAYFADGLTDEVRSRLAGVDGLRVIGGTSARQYKGTTKTAREIARELGATHLLTATVRWDRAAGGGAHVRVSPELVRAADQASIWAEPVEAPYVDVFRVQADVAERVAKALDVALVASERRTVASRSTANPAAYNAYLRGLAYGAPELRFSAPKRRAAIEAFEQAVALDSTFAAAHARLATAYWREMAWGANRSDLSEKMRMAVERAVALDSTLVETRLARAQYLWSIEDPQGAYRVLQAAARTAPGNAEVVLSLGNAQVWLGLQEEALASYQYAAQLDPRWADVSGALAGVYDVLFRNEEAIEVRDRELALSPPHVWGHVYQASSYLLWRADIAAARAVLASADAQEMVDLLTRLPSPFQAGRAIWLDVLPPEVLAAKDTVTSVSYVRGDWGTPELFHLMKARHFALTGKPRRARAHADSLVRLLEPVLRQGPGAWILNDFVNQQQALAEAYAFAGRAAEAARWIDRDIAEQRAKRAVRPASDLPQALVTAAYVDVLIGRRDSAVARLEGALRLPAGGWISRALLRADPSWAPLRGHPGFERLLAGGR